MAVVELTREEAEDKFVRIRSQCAIDAARDALVEMSDDELEEALDDMLPHDRRDNTWHLIEYDFLAGK